MSNGNEPIFRWSLEIPKLGLAIGVLYNNRGFMFIIGFLKQPR